MLDISPQKNEKVWYAFLQHNKRGNEENDNIKF